MKKPIKCPYCQNTHLKFLFKSKDRMFPIKGDFEVWKCQACKLVFLNPQLSKAQLVKYYPSKKYYAYTNYDNQGLLAKIREYLIKHYYKPNFISILISLVIHNVPAIPSFVEHGKVLDLGCGTGDTLISLKKLGWNVYGMDMDKNALLIAGKRGLKQLRLGTYEDLDVYNDHNFDAIRLYHVIEHLDQPWDCFKLLKKKLKKGGELIVGTPNINCLLARITGTYWYNLDSPRHLFLFTPRTLRNMAEKEGFKMKSIEFCSAGGIAGSIQYWLKDKYNIKIDLIHKLWFILLMYPLEWILDKFNTGDVFVMRFTY